MKSTLLLICVLLVTSASGDFYTCDRTAPCGCSSVSSTEITSRIVGGGAAQVHAWGWMVSLQTNNVHLCGASLLTAEYAVTAAHCFPDWIRRSSYSILVGTNYLDDNSSETIQRRPIIETHIHPGFDGSTYANDIAIVRFAPLSMGPNSTLSFICLPSNGTDPFAVGDTLVAIGWGKTNFTSADASNYLQQVTVNAFPSDATECQLAEIYSANLQFCASVAAGNKDTCQGDSGGPLMAFINNRWVLAGLTSYGHECAVPGYAGVYTRVSSFTSYIQSFVNTSITVPPLALTTSISTSSAQVTSTSKSPINAGVFLSQSILAILFPLFIVILC